MHKGSYSSEGVLLAAAALEKKAEETQKTMEELMLMTVQIHLAQTASCWSGDGPASRENGWSIQGLLHCLYTTAA